MFSDCKQTQRTIYDPNQQGHRQSHPMQNFSASPREMIGSLWRNKGFIRSLIHREIVGRYKGFMLGILWSRGHFIK